MSSPHQPYNPDSNQWSDDPQSRVPNDPYQQQDTAQKPRKRRGRGCALAAGVVVVGLLLFGACNEGTEEDTNADGAGETTTSSSVADETTTSQETPPADNTPLEETEAQEQVDSVPTEFRAALSSAESYVDFSSFSYAGLYDQLTSEYADQFSPEAAQYAVDTVGADWNAEALESAESYLEYSGFSSAGLYDQLTSDYADKFTPEQAQYAVDTVDADWNAEALEAAESYMEFSPMSPDGLYDQLTSEYADKFTPEQAQYAVDNTF